MKDLGVRGTAAVEAWLVALRDRSEGATAAEYALLVALVAVVIVVSVRFLGTSITGVFNKAGSSISNAAT